MSVNSASLIRTWKVGKYAVTGTFPQQGTGEGVSCEWDPCLPDLPLSPIDLTAYQVGLTSALLEAYGSPIIFLDV